MPPSLASEKVCPQCGSSNPPGTLICRECKTILLKAGEKRPASPLFIALLIVVILALLIYIIVIIRQIMANQY